MDTREPTLAHRPPVPRAPHRGTPDARGFHVFDGGDLGNAHVEAHRMLDAGRFDEGHRRLGAWLEGRVGGGSDWVHLQWHMLVFELAVGEVDAALERFEAHVAPAIADGQARTDGPAALWRLRFARAPEARLRPHWQAAAAVARGNLSRTADAWPRIHDLLALGGARDVDAIDAWLTAPPSAGWDPEASAGVRLLARGLRSAARGEEDAASARLDAAVARCNQVGGSAAQCTLFAALARWAAMRRSGLGAQPSCASSRASRTSLPSRRVPVQMRS